MNATTWTAIGAFAIETRSVTQAARAVAKLNRRRARLSGGSGVVNGVRWMCLARFEREIAGREAA